jgi:hypothetical protein
MQTARTLQGTGPNAYSTAMDKKGLFRFDGVAPGDYTISFVTEHPAYSVGPDQCRSWPFPTIRLANKGCAEVQFYEDLFATEKSE